MVLVVQMVSKQTVFIIIIIIQLLQKEFILK